MTPPCVPAPANHHRVRISSSANHRPRLCFKDLHSRTSSLFKLSCDGHPRHVHYDSGDLGGSHCLVTDPRPPSSSSARRTVRLASRLDGPFPSSQLWASGKCLNISNSPAKRRRGRPTSILATAAASPGLASAAFLLRSSLHTQALTSYSTRLSHKPPCFVHLVHGFSLALQIIHYSASPGVRLQLCHISTSSFLLRQRSTCSSAPPTDIHHSNARPGSSVRSAIRALLFSLPFFQHSCPAKLNLLTSPLQYPYELEWRRRFSAVSFQFYAL
ncbi:hypothetical protein CRENBAI_003827 [Crenichthys baileyi]|uniref:Uncharacterized protein n=1 Tax=Crenichthys baileyi TaxID=28760 RepID=A0AAV9S1V8_9TELE